VGGNVVAGNVSEKWSSSQACRTYDGQSKVHTIGMKKPGGVNYDTLPQQISSGLCKALIARRLGGTRRSITDRGRDSSRGRARVSRVAPEISSQNKEGERDATSESTQSDRLHPKSQQARCSLWKVNAPTAQKIMDKVKKVSRLEKKKRVDHVVSVQLRDRTRQRKAATECINELMSLPREETCGQVKVENLNNSFGSCLKTSTA
jgi:hypothetical protein